MKKLLPGLFLISFLNYSSQTFTLTQVANQPAVGDTERVYIIDTSAYTGGLNVASTGANHVWTYTNLITTSNSLTSAYLAPGSVPSASLYPGCTFVKKQGTINSFYKSVASPSVQTEFMGIYSASLNLNFSNTAVLIRYPFALGNSFTDSFSGTFTFSLSGNANGNATVTADGTGTLNLPDGIILNDVLRIKSYQSTNFTSGVIPVGSLKQTVYSFYHASQKFPILTIDYSVLTAFSNATLSAIISGNENDFTVGLEDNQTNLFKSIIYPNPVSDYLNIILSTYNKAQEISIYNQIGELVYKNTFENKINLSALKAGIYLLEIKTDAGISRKKIIKE